MITLGWPWHFLQQGQVWENANSKDFMESFKDFGLNIGIYRWLIKWLFEDLISTKRQGHYLTFDTGLLSVIISYISILKSHWAKFRVVSWGWENKCSNSQGSHDKHGLHAQIWSKYFQNLLQNQLTYGTDNWCAALGTPVI